MIVIADEITVGVRRQNLFQDPFLAGLENSRRRDENFRLPASGFRLAAASRVKQSHRLAIFFRVLKFAIHRLHAAFQRGFKLRQAADEDKQFRAGDARLRIF